MDCWICKKTALGVCRFCGRGVCEEHAGFQPYIMAVYRSKKTDVQQALVVEDALFCGICKPRPEPIPMEELE